MFATRDVKAPVKIGANPSPIGGINARDPLVGMAPTDAIQLQNWWPQPYGLSVRPGYRARSIGMTGTVHSCATLTKVNGTQAVYAWAGTRFYDITTPGVAPAATYTTLLDQPWQTVHMTNSAGSHLIAVNGGDNPIIINNAGTIARITAGDGIVNNTWAGLDPTKAVQLTIHQRRLWAVEVNTANGWFLPADAKQGTFKKVDFGPLFSRGGSLYFLATWTVDDSSGARDLLVGVSTNGEAAVYAGIDPEVPADWELVGVYNIGTPIIGRRCFAKVGGDLYILTTLGLVSMSKQLSIGTSTDETLTLQSDKIQYLLSELTRENSTLAGWDMKFYSARNMLLINVPSTVDSNNIQLASNQELGSWTQFTNIDALCWSTIGDEPIFGDYDGNVWQFGVGYVDRVALDGSGGSGIVANAQQAYTYLGQNIAQKQMGMYRFNFSSSGAFAFKSKLTYDFAASALPVANAQTIPDGSFWDTGLWNQATWYGQNKVQQPWVQGEGMGAAVSVMLSVRTTSELLWISTDYSYVQGQGIL